MKTYIYILKDPITNNIRYVGKTIHPKNRLKSHKCLKAKKGTYLSCWIESLRNKNLSPVMEIIDEVEGIGWKEKEQYYIDKYKKQGYLLVNLTNGGEGCHGYKHNEFSLKKMRECKIGKKIKYIPSFIGFKHKKESKEKISMMQIGEKNHNYGKKTASEIKFKISEKMGKQVIIEDIVYPSLRKAAESLNIPWSTFKYRYKGIYF